jgi:hypothetical protein
VNRLSGPISGSGGRSEPASACANEKWTRRCGARAIFVFAVVPNRLFDPGGMAARSARYALVTLLLGVLGRQNSSVAGHRSARGCSIQSRDGAGPMNPSRPVLTQLEV